MPLWKGRKKKTTLMTEEVIYSGRLDDKEEEREPRHHGLYPQKVRILRRSPEYFQRGGRGKWQGYNKVRNFLRKGDIKFGRQEGGKEGGLVVLGTRARTEKALWLFLASPLPGGGLRERYL